MTDHAADVEALTAFVTARLDEREAAALAADGRRWEWTGVGAHGYPQRVTSIGNAGLIAECYESPDHPSTHAEHIALNDPAQVLADVTAQRRIVERYAYLAEHGDPGDGLWVLAHLATAYAAHPDYRQEWTP